MREPDFRYLALDLISTVDLPEPRTEGVSGAQLASYIYEKRRKSFVGKDPHRVITSNGNSG
jgi:hypothetical protein